MSRKLDVTENESDRKKLKIFEQDELDNCQYDTDEPKLVSNESNYGIKERVNKNNDLFKAILKQRFILFYILVTILVLSENKFFSPCDFIVNEVDLDGKVVRLTNFDIPLVEEIPKQSTKELETIVSHFNIISNNLLYC